MKLLSLLIFILFTFCMFSQSVSNVKIEQKGEHVKIIYDLNAKMDITLVMSTDSGYNYHDVDCAVEYINGKFQFKANYIIKSDGFPMIEVTWAGAVAFAKWVGGRLPTEAEWEYAAKGGAYSNNYLFVGSNEAKEVAVYVGTSKRNKKPLLKRKPNELGLYDMSGNVWEWCSDWYGSYSKHTLHNPSGAVKGNFRVTF